MARDSKDWVSKEPVLISKLSKAERRYLGRRVLNATIKNSPAGMRVDSHGNLFLANGDILRREYRGTSGRNAKYEYFQDGKTKGFVPDHTVLRTMKKAEETKRKEAISNPNGLNMKDVNHLVSIATGSQNKDTDSIGQMLLNTFSSSGYDSNYVSSQVQKLPKKLKSAYYKKINKYHSDKEKGKGFDTIEVSDLYGKNVPFHPDILPKEMLPKLRKDGFKLQKDTNNDYIIRNGEYVFETGSEWVEDGFGKDDADDKNLTRLNQNLTDVNPPWKRDRTTSFVDGKKVWNANKDYNQKTPRQLQDILSRVHDKRVYKNEDGTKYQLSDTGSKIPFKGETGFLYGGGSKTDPNIIKFGYGKWGVLARYAEKKDWKRYGNNKSKSKGYPSGAGGIDAKTAFMDWELPVNVAKGAEKFIHGNFKNLDSRMMFDDGTPESKSLRKLFGSGASEYYAQNHMSMMNAPKEPASITDKSESFIDKVDVPVEDMFYGLRGEKYNRSTLSGSELARLKQLESIKDKDRPWFERDRDNLSVDGSGAKYAGIIASTPLGQVLGDKYLREGRAERERIAKLDTSPSALDNVVGDAFVPLSVKHGINVLASAKRLADQYENVGAGSILEDVGNSTMAALASPFSDSSSNWWKSRLNTPKGEATNIGNNIADEALSSVAGGAIGKGIGAGYKGIKRGAQMFDHKMAKKATSHDEYEELIKPPKIKPMFPDKRSTVGDTPYGTSFANGKIITEPSAKDMAIAKIKNSIFVNAPYSVRGNIKASLKDSYSEFKGIRNPKDAYNWFRDKDKTDTVAMRARIKSIDAADAKEAADDLLVNKLLDIKPVRLLNGKSVEPVESIKSINGKFVKSSNDKPRLLNGKPVRSLNGKPVKPVEPVKSISSIISDADTEPFRPGMMDQLARVKNIALSRKSAPSGATLPEPVAPFAINAIDSGISRIRNLAGKRGTLKRNNNELNELYKQTGSLKEARKLQRDRWNQLPNDSMKKGVLTGSVLPVLTNASPSEHLGNLTLSVANAFTPTPITTISKSTPSFSTPSSVPALSMDAIRTKAINSLNARDKAINNLNARAIARAGVGTNTTNLGTSTISPTLPPQERYTAGYTAGYNRPGTSTPRTTVHNLMDLDKQLDGYMVDW